MWNILLVTDCMVVNHYFTHVGCKFNAFYVYHHKASHSQLIHTVEFLSIWWWEESLTSRISVIIVRYSHVSAIAVISTLILQWSTPVVVFWNLRKFDIFTKLNRLPLLNLVNWILLLFYDPIRWITWSKHGVLMHTKIEPSCTLRFINNADTPLQCWKWETCFLLFLN